MAYAALINLSKTHQLVKQFSQASEQPENYYFPNYIEYPKDEIEFLEEVIEKLDGKSRDERLKAFQVKIREAVHGYEDVLDALVSNVLQIGHADILSTGNKHPAIYAEEIRQGFNLFVETVKRVNEELEYPLPEDDADDDGKKLGSINSEELKTKIIDQLNTCYKSFELRVVSIVGVAGSGRTTFAWTLFHHQESDHPCDYLRAMVCVGPKFEFKEILMSILSQIDDPNLGNVYEQGEDKIFEYLYAILKGQKYLIVLDDVRETRVWEYLRMLFPDENNGSRLLLTTHLHEVAVFAQSFSIHPTPVFNNEQSWNIISRVLFPDHDNKCPPEFDKAGKKIAENCQGLLIEVAKYADILSKVEQTPELWNKVVEEMKNSAANEEEYDEISEISKMMGNDCSVLYTSCDDRPKIMEALGLPDATNDIRKSVFVHEIEIHQKIVALVGTRTIDQSGLAREVFDDPRTIHSYDHRVWLTIGPEYDIHRILVDVLAQLDPNIDIMQMEDDDETSFKHISSILSGKRCFIVLDKVWHKFQWDFLGFVLVINAEVLLTTRQAEVAWEYFGESGRHRIHEIGVFFDMPWGSIYEGKVRQTNNSFVKRVKKIKEEYSNDSDDNDEEEDYDDYYKSSTSRIDDIVGNKPKMVGSKYEEVITRIREQLNSSYKSCEVRVVSIVGVAGTGRSAFAWRLFHKKDSRWVFELRALVCIGPNDEFKDILVSILTQIDDSDDNHKLLESEGEEEIYEYLYTILKGGTYLIVLDNVRETRVWEYLRKLFPNENNGSRVLLTTHLEEVAVYAQSFSIHPTPLLNKGESWDVISRVLFDGWVKCPPQLEKVGKKIAKNCGGLLVEVARHAEILSKVDQTLKHWNNVEAEMVNYVVNNDDAYDEMSEISKMMGDGYSNPMKKVLGLYGGMIDIKKNIYTSPTSVVGVIGMAGIGKTALAREIFDDPWTLRSYEHRVWLTLGPKYQAKRILVDILDQLDPNFDKMDIEDDEATTDHIISILSDKTCFFVLDDVWEDNIGNYWTNMFKKGGIKCEVLFTTRQWSAPFTYFHKLDEYNNIHEMSLLNTEESWSLLRERVFGEELWPRELEKPGKLIAENCDGLPLTIVTVASHLSKAEEKTPEYWNEVANEKNSVFELAYLEISEVLYPSYKKLDLAFRACFLYMAAFRVKYEIPISKLYMLYSAEGIIPKEGSSDADINFIDNMEQKFLENSVVLSQFSCKINTFRLHSVFWHLCVREARNDKFFHVLKRRADGLTEDIEKQRRLCVQNNVLFAIKDVYDSIASVSAAARSLLCFGPPHPYQVPLCLEMKLLKVLDALTFRFYEFPLGIFKLILLRYLALTYNSHLPAEIFHLWCLEFLIIHQHMSIKFPGDLSFLPKEIWNMRNLKHLEIMGSNLPHPPDSNAHLRKLETLLDVRAESCTKSILKEIPSLRKLGIRIELAPDHASEPSFSFDPISCLKRIKSLKCVIVNPELKSEVVVAPPASLSMLPSTLKELTLSGFGYDWEHIRPIAMLPNLEELELQCYAFRGAAWVMHEGDFKRLCYLLLEDTDLVEWTADEDCHLLSLANLTIRQGFKLKEIPWQSLPRSCETELVDCNFSASEKMEENIDCNIICSWVEDGKSTLANQQHLRSKGGLKVVQHAKWRKIFK